MNASDQFDKRRAIADLESDIEAELSFRALADVHNFERAWDVHGHRLLAINVFACGHDGFQMLRMKIRRGGDDDGVYFFGSGNLLVRFGSEKKLRGIQGGKTLCFLQFVEMRSRLIKLVLKHI